MPMGEGRASYFKEGVSFIHTTPLLLFNFVMVHGGCVGLGNEYSISKTGYRICGNQMITRLYLAVIGNRFFFSEVNTALKDTTE